MDKNLDTYNSKTVVSWYSQLQEITRVEKMVFEKYKNCISSASLLDIGIGGGRTTHFLLNKCKKYVGIDYSKQFVSVVKNKFPEASILVCDARSLTPFEDCSFDFVNFSFNGIDYVDLADRKKIFSEIHRILKPNSIFFFSTHNKNHRSFNVNPWRNNDLSFIKKLKTGLKLLPFLSKKIKNKKYELINPEYAIINDSAHNYGLMTFYASPKFLRAQLFEFGFNDVEFYTKSGASVSDELLDDWIFATCKKVSL